MTRHRASGSLRTALLASVISVVVLGTLASIWLLHREARNGLFDVYKLSLRAQADSLIARVIVDPDGTVRVASSETDDALLDPTGRVASYAVLSAAGKVLHATNGYAESIPEALLKGLGNDTFFGIDLDWLTGGHSKDVFYFIWPDSANLTQRISIYVPFTKNEAHFYFQLTADDLTKLFVTYDFLTSLAEESITIILLPFLLALAAIVWTVHRSLHPIRSISAQAARIGPSSLHLRLDDAHGPREIRPLVQAFNTVLDRLDASWQIQREFTANAAHELRTPLAALRAQIEERLDPATQADLARGVDRLTRLLSQLLLLAEAEAASPDQAIDLDLGELAQSSTLEMAMAVLASGRNIAFDGPSSALRIRGNPELIAAAIRNLVENSINHTPVGTEIIVTVASNRSISVADNGPGLAPSVRARACDRFWKFDRRSPGAGLGLAIVADIMKAHNGGFRLEALATGARFVLEFP